MAARWPVPVEEELRRLAPVLPAAVALGVPVSIDTMKAEVAAWALASRRRDRQRRLGPAARPGPRARGRRARACRSSSCTTATAPIPSIDIMADIAAFFARSLEIAARAGIAREHIVLDPGIGFGKTPEQSLIAIARLAELKSFGLPLLRRRLAQALHRQGFARPARPAARRIDRRSSPGGRRAARRSSVPMTSPRPCRRCA